MFAGIKKAWNEARGARLEQELTDAFGRLRGADPKLYGEIHKHLAPLYERVQKSLFNMTPAGQVSAGRGFQQEARRKFDFDVGQGYALWIIGVWMESAHVAGESAKNVHSFLSDFLGEMCSRDPSGPPSETPSIKGAPETAGAMEMLVMQVSVQLGMGGCELEEFSTLALTDDFVLGYIAGAADALSRAEGKTAQADSIASIVIALMQFCNEDELKAVTKRFGIVKNRPEFIAAMRSGGQDYVDMFKQKTPLSLAEHLLAAT